MNAIFNFLYTNSTNTNGTATTGPIGEGALTLYMYAVGSPFEATLTNYMITSQPVHPPNAPKQLLNGSSIRLAANRSLEIPSLLKSFNESLGLSTSKY